MTLTPAQKARVTRIARNTKGELFERVIGTHIRLGKLPDDREAIRDYARKTWRR